MLTNAISRMQTPTYGIRSNTTLMALMLYAARN